jgi:hypothetical protein
VPSALAPGPSPTTAVVGAPSPAPVVVVDDATTNPWDVASVIIGTLGVIVSAFLAWRALKIGEQANEAARYAAKEAERANAEASKARAAVAAERRRTFELEVLRDLVEVFEVLIPTQNTLGQAGAPRLPRLREIASRAALQLNLLMPTDDLPTWRALTRAAEFFQPQSEWSEAVRRLGGAEDEGILRRRMIAEVTEAVQRRMNALDD